MAPWKARLRSLMPLIHNVTREWRIDWFMAATVKVDGLSGGVVVDRTGWPSSSR